MKIKILKKKQKGIAERKTETQRRTDIPYKSIGIAIILWLTVTWFFFGRGIVPQITYQAGQIIPTTVEARVEFSCENLHDTALAREQEANSLPLIFKMDPAPCTRSIQKIKAVFDRLEQVAAAPDDDKAAKIQSLTDLLIGSDINDPSLFVQAFPSNSIASARDITLEGIQSVMNVGIMSDETRETFASEIPDRALSIVTETAEPPKQEQLKNIYSRRQAVWTISEKIENRTARDLLDKLLFSVVENNLSYDKTATEALRKAAADSIEPIMQFYPAGTVLVRAGERADEQNLLLLQMHIKQIQNSRETSELALEILGNGLLLLAGLFATAVILRICDGKLIRQIDKLLFLMIVSLITLGTASLLTYISFQHPLITPSMVPYLVPHALAVLLTGILLGGGAAIAIGFWNSFAVAVLLDQSFAVFALGMLVTITATSTARNVHRRSSLFRAGLWVCAVKVLYVLLIAAMNQQTTAGLMAPLSCAVLSGVLSTVLTLLLIPIFEKLFKITTDITLLELSDMGHPLLQKMAMQAPGTYHHSLMVATLAQNAAEAIGANSLLIRVCAYYHDIGKMAKPEFFTENIQHKENPHDELSPHMSALVISSHVKEGLALAKRHKLPQPIMDAIEQHHGNGLISFFYHKAKQIAKEGNGGSMKEVINDSDFRYGGAPAVSKEMAILSLADASEAASRSIEKPTPQKIANLLNDIFSIKIRDGQLDYANLTMAEINAVKQSFIFSLSNMLHGRIPYPKDNDNKYSKPSESSDTVAPVAKAD
jgi:putative nucleotidyltransferase with HDIG domain